jgi:hypothetical protein
VADARVLGLPAGDRFSTLTSPLGAPRSSTRRPQQRHAAPCGAKPMWTVSLLGARPLFDAALRHRHRRSRSWAGSCHARRPNRPNALAPCLTGRDHRGVARRRRAPGPPGRWARPFRHRRPIGQRRVDERRPPSVGQGSVDDGHGVLGDNIWFTRPPRMGTNSACRPRRSTTLGPCAPLSARIAADVRHSARRLLPRSGGSPAETCRRARRWGSLVQLGVARRSGDLSASAGRAQLRSALYSHRKRRPQHQVRRDASVRPASAERRAPRLSRGGRLVIVPVRCGYEWRRQAPLGWARASWV